MLEFGVVQEYYGTMRALIVCLGPKPNSLVDYILSQEGYAVSRSHIESNALKTNCPMSECIRVAQELQQ